MKKSDSGKQFLRYRHFVTSPHQTSVLKTLNGRKFFKNIFSKQMQDLIQKLFYKIL